MIPSEVDVNGIPVGSLINNCLCWEGEEDGG